MKDELAEFAVLGALLADSRHLAEVLDIIKDVADFTVERNRLIFEAIVALDAAKRSVDTLSLADELRARRTLEKAGGLPFLVELDTAAPTSANVLEYARIVADESLRRKATRLTGEAKAKLESGFRPSEVLAQTQVSLMELERDPTSGGLIQVGEPMQRTLDNYERASNLAGVVTGLSSGFIDLDQLTTGMHPGELHVLAARPATGKTMMAFNFVAHVVLKLKEPAAVFSLEMPIEQLLQRMIASESGVSLKAIRKGKVPEYEMGRFNDAAAAIHGAPLYVDDQGGISIIDMRARLRKLFSRGVAPRIAIVDFLQLMGAGVKTNNEEQTVGIVSRGLKAMSKEFGIPILALAQLNRKTEEREGPPRLSDIRSSGSVEQDADTVMFLHEQDEALDPPVPGIQAPPTPVDLIIAKQRNGPPGTVSLLRRSHVMRFESVVRDSAGPELSPPLPSRARDFTQPPEAD